MTNTIHSNTLEAAQTVVAELSRLGLTLMCAESCTGGMIAARITDIGGASAVFRGGLVTYCDHAKVSLLGVRRETLARHGAVSEQVAREMAQCGLQVMQADAALAVTGIAGPSGGTLAKPIGLVHIAAAVVGSPTIAKRYEFRPRHRAAVRMLAVQAGLQLLSHALAVQSR